MSVGFTGTQKGMTPQQGIVVRQILHILDEDEFHHGMCWGSDEEAHWIAGYERYRIIGHPPLDKRKLMRTPASRCHELRPARPYLVRNHDIVDEVSVMIATPSSRFEELRSGTWATIRYTRKVRRPLLLVWPDGKITQERLYV